MAFTEFPVYEPTSRETNRKGILACRRALGQRDPITRKFNRLSEQEKGLLAAVGGASESDLSNHYKSNFRLENYSREGYKKIVKGIRLLRRLSNKFPCDAVLNVYTSADELKRREARKQKYYSR